MLRTRKGIHSVKIVSRLGLLMFSMAGWSLLLRRITVLLFQHEVFVAFGAGVLNFALALLTNDSVAVLTL